MKQAVFIFSLLPFIAAIVVFKWPGFLTAQVFKFVPLLIYCFMSLQSSYQ